MFGLRSLDFSIQACLNILICKKHSLLYLVARLRGSHGDSLLALSLNSDSDVTVD